MAYPWNAGDTLNAADLNNYAGLVFVKSQTIGSSVSSVTLSNVFSADFQNYKVVVTGISNSTTATLRVVFGGSTNHYGTLMWNLYNGTNGRIDVLNGSNIPVGYTISAPADNGCEFTVTRPNVSSYTQLMGTGMGAGFTNWFGGTDFTVRSHTDLTLSISAGTMTGGTVRVYGYNDG